jgi:hypothetical protein
MEEPGLGATTEAILTFFQRAIKIVKGVAAHFLFAWGEIFHQDWADGTEKGCRGPGSHAEKQGYMPVSRTVKRLTLME